MCSRVLLLFGKLPQGNLHVNCQVNPTAFQSGLRFQTNLSSLPVSSKRAWNLYRRGFHFAWTHVNANRNEILTRSEISNRFEFTLPCTGVSSKPENLQSAKLLNACVSFKYCLRQNSDCMNWFHLSVWTIFLEMESFYSCVFHVSAYLCDVIVFDDTQKNGGR